jgi:D-alanyl-D-alanine carboxypeptidase (penicillin-binding protein 5/6)
VNSAGLPHPDQYTSAADVAILSRAMIREFPEYYRWYSEREFTVNGIKQGNRNLLLYRDPTVDGIKTGRLLPRVVREARRHAARRGGDGRSEP